MQPKIVGVAKVADFMDQGAALVMEVMRAHVHEEIEQLRVDLKNAEMALAISKAEVDHARAELAFAREDHARLAEAARIEYEQSIEELGKEIDDMQSQMDRETRRAYEMSAKLHRSEIRERILFGAWLLVSLAWLLPHVVRAVRSFNF